MLRTSELGQVRNATAFRKTFRDILKDEKYHKGVQFL